MQSYSIHFSIREEIAHFAGIKEVKNIGPEDGKIYGNLTIICEQAQTVKLKTHPSMILSLILCLI